MTEPKFTKGPWFITKEDWVTGGYDIAVIQDKNGEEVLGISEWIRVNEPDLRLIAAAPDMYEALEAYEKLEADILLNANWNTPSGVPQITQEQFDWLIACQTLQARALRKARGETNL